MTPVPRHIAATELAAIAYAQIVWGKEPHPSQVTPAMRAEWDEAKARWIAGMAKCLDAMAGEGQIELVP